MTEDYYALLGVDRDASEAAILEAYRDRAADHHPDVSDDEDAGETFQRLKRAKEVLTDDERRREYDSLGHERFLERADGDDRSTEPPAYQSVSVTEPPAGFPGWVNSQGSPDVSGTDTGWIQRLVGRRASVGQAAGRRELDLRAFLRGTQTRRGPSGRDPEPNQPTEERSHPCPECGGRGSFVHELDTGLGQRRRIEPCRRCDGAGTLDR